MQVSFTIPNPIKSVKRKLQDKIVGHIIQDTSGNIWGLDSFPKGYFADPQLAFNIVWRLSQLGYDVLWNHVDPKQIDKAVKSAKLELEFKAGKYDKVGKLIQEGELQKVGARLVEFMADGGYTKRTRGLSRADDMMIDEWISVEMVYADNLYLEIAKKKEILALLEAYQENTLK